MLARCARCQGTFTTDRYGRQFCPHCGSELILADPNAGQPPPAPPEPPPGPPSGEVPGWGAAPPPAPPAGGEPPTFPPPPAGGTGWAPPPPPPPPGDVPAPFADRGRKGFFPAFFATWKLAVLEPQKFFATVRVDQPGPAILFGLLAAWVGGTVAALFGLLTNMSTVAMMQEIMGKLPPEQADVMNKLMPLLMGGGTVARIVLVPIQVVFGMFVMAGIVHLVLLMFKGAPRGFTATLTVVAFSYGVHLIDAVPGCGALVSGIWQLVIVIIGLAAIHRTETWKSAVATLSPIVLCCCCVCGLGGTIGAMAGAAGKHAGGGVSDL